VHDDISVLAASVERLEEVLRLRDALRFPILGSGRHDDLDLRDIAELADNEIWDATRVFPSSIPPNECANYLRNSGSCSI